MNTVFGEDPSLFPMLPLRSARVRAPVELASCSLSHVLFYLPRLGRQLVEQSASSHAMNTHGSTVQRLFA